MGSFQYPAPHTNLFGGRQMKRLFVALISANIVFSIYLFLNKMFLQNTTCKACSKLPLSDIQLAFMALISSLTIALLYFLSLKSKAFWYVYVGYIGLTAIVSSGLMSLQLRAGHIICWPCFLSSAMFYLIFVVFVLQYLSPWLRQKWFSQ